MKLDPHIANWIDVCTDAALVFDKDGAAVYVNNAGRQMLSESEIERAKEARERIIAASSHEPFTWNVSNNEKPHTVHSGCLNGYYYAVFKDVRDADELATALRYNKTLYTGLANGTIEGLALINNNKAVDSNAQMWITMGVNTAQELGEIDWEAQLGERNWKRLMSRLDEVLEFEFVNAGGKPIVVEGKMTIVDKESGFKALALLDITDKRKISKDLLQTKERFRLLVETNPFGLLLAVDGRVRYANQAGLEILGIEEEEVFDQEVIQFFAPSDRSPIQEDIDRILNGEKTTYLEVQVNMMDKQLKEVGVQMVLSFFDNQPAVQITMNDLSTQMQLVREQLKRTSAEEANVLLKEEILQHRETQKQLEGAERFNRSIIESSIDMIVALDVKGNILQFNHAASVEFGMSADDVKDMTAADFLSNPEDAENIISDLDRQGYYAGEISGKRSTGEVFQMLISIASLQNEKGEGTGYVLVGRDITDIRFAEQELRRSDERYRDILENASDLVFQVNAKGGLEYANPAFFESLGYSPKELKSVLIPDVIETPTNENKENWMELLAGQNNELNFRNKNGSILKVLGGGSVQTTNQGDLIGLRCIYSNVSEVRAYQRDAREKSAKLESIFNSTRYLLMFTIDKDLRVTSVNQNLRHTLKEQFGFDTEIGTPIIETLKNFTEKSLYQGQFRLFSRAAQGTQQQFELPLVTQSGEVAWYQLFVNPVVFEEGTEELSCIAYDITERKEIDNKIREALKEKEVLLQEVHHRVKNNLQVISSMLNLQRRFVDDQKMLDVLEESQNRISTMSFIHESLYQNSDFSSIGFADYLERLTQNLIQSYSNISARVELTSQLDDIYINLKQAIPCGLIVNELVSNCLKYAFKGRETGKIFLRVEKKGDELEIEVADNGVGLPDNFNIETNESLGVYLVQALTDQLDGALVVDNKQSDKALDIETGASFLVRFTPVTL